MPPTSSSLNIGKHGFAWLARQRTTLLLSCTKKFLCFLTSSWKHVGFDLTHKFHHATRLGQHFKSKIPSYWESISSQSFNHLVDQWSTINICLLLAGLRRFSARSRLRSRDRWCRLGCLSCTRQIWKSGVFLTVFCSRLRCCGPNGIRRLTCLLQYCCS